MSKRLITTLLVLVSMSSNVIGQKTAAWESKPIDQWNETDVADILQRSAWGQRLNDRIGQSSFAGLILQDFNAAFILRSALTIRLALIKQKQLSEKYDSMSETQRNKFNEKYRSLRECEQCERYYIVSVHGDSRVLSDPSDINRRLKTIYLANDKGERRILEKFVRQTQRGAEALFFFPRNDENGKPLLTVDNKTLTFNLRTEPNDDNVMRLIERVQVKVKDLVRDGIVIF